MSENNPNDLKMALAQWARHNKIRPVDFARRMNYSAAYGWSLLRGRAEMTPEALGRFALAYGSGAVAELLLIAAGPEKLNVLPETAPTDTAIPPN